MKRNPFDKFIKGETAIHFAVAEYLQYQYPSVMFHHSPNESRRTPFERYLISKMGVSAGYPDFVIYHNNYTFAMELKHKNNVPTESQIKWLKKFYSMRNGFSCVAWSVDTAIRFVDSFLKVGNNAAFELMLIDSAYFVELNDDLPKSIIKKINQ
jgi:hypothetical protein